MVHAHEEMAKLLIDLAIGCADIKPYMLKVCRQYEPAYRTPVEQWVWHDLPSTENMIKVDCTGITQRKKPEDVVACGI